MEGWQLSYNMKKTQGKSQSLSAPHRYPTPGHVDAPAPPFPWVYMRVLLPFPPPSAFQLFFTVLQGQWEGGREGGEGKVCFYLPHHAAARNKMCPSAPSTSLSMSQNCPVLNPGLNRKTPEVMLQPQALFSQIPRTV